MNNIYIYIYIIMWRSNRALISSVLHQTAVLFGMASFSSVPYQTTGATDRSNTGTM